MENSFEIINQDGDDLIVSPENSITLRVIPPEKKAARELCSTSVFECPDYSIGVIINDVLSPDTLFPVTMNYDFQIMGNDLPYARPKFKLWVEAIEYYCTTRLQVKKEQLNIVDFDQLESDYAEENSEITGDKIVYDFRYFEGEDKQVIYLSDGSFSMGIEEREPSETESGPVLSATLFQPFVDGHALRFSYDDWEIRSNYVFTILVCDQPIDGFMKPKEMYFDAIDHFFVHVLGTNNYQPGLPYYSYMFQDE